MICRADLVQRSSSPVQATYELQAGLGRGGVGRVVQAVCRRNQIARAVKITSQKSDPSGFEVSLMRKLDHPNIVRLFETFVEETQGELHLAMELCKGGALPSYARDFWPPLEEAAGAVIMWQLLGALNYLQKQSLSHGDICPANVLMLHFDQPPEQNVTKLIDFGAHAGRRTHDLPSAGLVMRALLGWCSGMKCASLREAPAVKKGQTTVYSEGGLGVPISKPASDLMARFAGAEADAAFTAEKALHHTWFILARHGEVPVRRMTSKRGATRELF
ncbi:CPK3 [Symbiodinium natans]|uniref:CPK3 protein n=1 Tax=Symbiodinium natans TaxID=878477 RepID=A0A812R8S0_9DINO|nr:CPK3 [Symbiodinium natans]